MKQWLDRAVAFRKMGNDFLAKARKEMQAPSRDDIDAVVLAVRQLEARVLDRVEQLARQVESLNAPSRPAQPSKATAHPQKKPRRSGPRRAKGKKS
jgi:hypothetical protein